MVYIFMKSPFANRIECTLYGRAQIAARMMAQIILYIWHAVWLGGR